MFHNKNVSSSASEDKSILEKLRAKVLHSKDTRVCVTVPNNFSPLHLGDVGVRLIHLVTWCFPCFLCLWFRPLCYWIRINLPFYAAHLERCLTIHKAQIALLTPLPNTVHYSCLQSKSPFQSPLPFITGITQGLLLQKYLMDILYFFPEHIIISRRGSVSITLGLCKIPLPPSLQLCHFVQLLN